MSSILERNGANIVYLECECSIAKHAIRITSFDEEGTGHEPLLCIETQLAQGGFWFRLRNALIYLFMGESNSWESTLLGVENVEKIENALLNFKRHHRSWRLAKEGKCKLCEGKGGVSSCNECDLCASCLEVGKHKKDCCFSSSFGLRDLENS